MMKLFTVGPVEMYPEILEIGSHQIPYFRNQYFSDIMYELDSNLKKLMNMVEDDKNIILTASGTGAMEAVVINCLTSEDKALVISGGSFGERFEQLCELYDIPYDTLRVKFGESFSADMLDKYESKGYTALLVNLHETSVGQLYPVDILSDFCQRNQMYFIVDAISAVFADEIDFTYHKIDALIFSSQKALALAPGIAIVSLSKKIIRRLNVKPKTMYFNFSDYLKNGMRGQTPFTPAVGIVIQTNAMIRAILMEGIKNKILKTRELAEYFRKQLHANGFEVPGYPLSNAMTPVWFGTGAKLYYESLIDDYEINVNPCGGELADKMFRVGHMGNLTVEDHDDLICALCKIRERNQKSI